MAAEVDRGVTVGGKSKAVEAISCKMGGYIHSRPCARGEASRNTEQCPHRRCVVVIDASLGPRVVTDGAKLIPGSGGTICMNTQNGAGDRTG